MKCRVVKDKEGIPAELIKPGNLFTDKTGAVFMRIETNGLLVHNLCGLDCFLAVRCDTGLTYRINNNLIVTPLRQPSELILVRDDQYYIKE